MATKKAITGTTQAVDRCRRHFLKTSALMGLVLANPVLAFDLNELLQGGGDSENGGKTGELLKGAGKILSSQKEMDFQSEFALGQSLALEGFRRYGLPLKSKSLQKYINLVGNTVARHSNRPGIPYFFVVVDSPLHNAFACPGGIVFISAALVELMEDEAELAAVLAHEVAHVGHRHALKSLKRAHLLEGVGQITAATMQGEDAEKVRQMVGGLQTILFDKGLDKNMEYEADASSVATTYRTGYDPRGMQRVLRKLEREQEGAAKAGSWFSTHPPLASRIEKAKDQRDKYRDDAGSAVVKTRFQRYKKYL